MAERLPSTIVTQDRIPSAAFLKSMAHPLRLRILLMLDEAPQSPVRMAAALGEHLNVVAYHVKRLEKLGLIELASTRRRRGATEHLYRRGKHAEWTDEEWAAVSGEDRARLSAAGLQLMLEYAMRAAAAGGFDRADAHSSRWSLTLDEQGWSDLSAATREWISTALATEEASKARDGTTFTAGLAILLFETLPLSQPADEAAGTDRAQPARSTDSRPNSSA
jgi:DNA-binding transcriptional ArsR family regulator